MFERMLWLDRVRGLQPITTYRVAKGVEKNRPETTQIFSIPYECHPMRLDVLKTVGRGLHACCCKCQRNKIVPVHC